VTPKISGGFISEPSGATESVFDRGGNGLIYVKENTLRFRPLSDRDGVNDRVIGDHQPTADILPLRWEEPDRVWSKDASTGELRCWSTGVPRGVGPLYVLTPGPELTGNRFAVRDGSRKWRLPVKSHDSKAPWLWDCSLLQASKPFELSANTYWYMSFTDIHPSGTWLVASAGHWDRAYFWPLVRAFPSVVEGYRNNYKPVAFSPDGQKIVTNWGDGSLRVWPLRSGDREYAFAPTSQGILGNLVFDPSGRSVISIGSGSTLSIVPLDGTRPQSLEGFSDNHLISCVVFSPSGRLAAAATVYGTVEPKVLRVWDLDSGEVQVFDLEPHEGDSREPDSARTGYEHGIGINGLAFMDESTLYGASTDGMMKRWDLGTGVVEVVSAADPSHFGGPSASGRCPISRSRRCTPCPTTS
jgi:WD40 repeat protein